MKNLTFLVFIMLFCFENNAFSQSECGTPTPAEPYIFKGSVQDSINGIMAINTPYCVRVYVTVFADNSGLNLAASSEDIERQFQNMVNQYDAHNICFMLIDIRQVNNTDLNNHTKAEVLELNPFMVDNCLNVFVHRTLSGPNGNLNGTAYAIPSTFLSLLGTPLASLTNVGLWGHEMGHCFGLYHTFETWNNTKRESVTRNPVNGCYDCLTDGDLLCDTPADDDGGQNASCVYTGGGTGPCGLAYAPATNNIMAYGNPECNSIMTASQGNRMRTFLLTDPNLNDLVNEDDLNRPSTSNSSIFYSTSTGVVISARDNLDISPFSVNAFNVTGNAEVYLQAKRVSLKPGTRFYPTTGRVSVKSNTYCD